MRAQFETMSDIADVKPDTTIEAELIGVLERFCSAFADRDAEAVIHLFVDDGDVGVATSEEQSLRQRSDDLLVGVGSPRCRCRGVGRMAARQGN